MRSAIILLLMIASSNVISQPLAKQWDYRYGGSETDLFSKLIHVSDNGFLIGGYSFSNISGDKTSNSWGMSDYWIVKTNASGIIEWEKQYGGNLDEYLFDFAETPDGGFILGGSSGSDISGDKTQPSWGALDYWIIKTDAAGNKQWDKRYGGLGGDYFASIEPTSDGGYILGGFSASHVSGDKSEPVFVGFHPDFWIVKIDSLGNKIWDKDYGGSGDEELNFVIQTSDNGYLAGGSTNSALSGHISQPSFGQRDYWIIKMDSTGNKLWDKRYGGNKGDTHLTAIETSDGGILLSGESNSPASGVKTDSTMGMTDFWIIKIDNAGDILWDADFGGTKFEQMYQVSETTDFGFLLTGTSLSDQGGNKSENNLGEKQLWLVKIDSSGNKIFDQTLLTTGRDENGVGVQVSDSCYVFANFCLGGVGGHKSQASWDTSFVQKGDYWLIKLCDTTLSTGADHFDNDPYNVTIFPNPTSGHAEIIFNNEIHGYAVVKLFNTLGQEIYQNNKRSIMPGEKLGLDLSVLTDGIYVLKIDTGTHLYTQKIIKQ